MAKQQQIQMPGVFGGLMRYDSEYKSKFMFSPATIIAFIIAIIVFVVILKLFFPITPPVGSSTTPVGQGGFIFPLIKTLLI